MAKKVRLYIFIALLTGPLPCFCQTWVDTLDSYARNSYLPASHYLWNWQDAALLNTMIKQYDLSGPSQKQVYFNYVKKAMDKTYWMANGKTPNSVASGLGMAFLY